MSTGTAAAAARTAASLSANQDACGGGKIVDSLSLFSDECVELLQQALETAGKCSAVVDPSSSSSPPPKIAFPSQRGSRFRQDDSSSSSEDEGNNDNEKGSDSSSSSASSNEGDDDEDFDGEDEGTGRSAIVSATTDSATASDDRIEIESGTGGPGRTTKGKKNVPAGKRERQRQAVVRKHVETVPCIALPLASSTRTTTPAERDADGNGFVATPPLLVHVPIALLSKDERRRQQSDLCRSLLSLANAGNASKRGNDKSNSSKTVVVLALRSGRFAGAVFRCDSRGGECVAHKTSVRYTVRKGQGKAQSAQDGQRRPKSMGAQLRRAGEQQLTEDIGTTLQEWRKQNFIHAERTALILISCPKTMNKSFFDAADGIIAKDDPRIRRVPMDVGRPSFESVSIIYSVMTTVTIRETVPVADDNAPIAESALPSLAEEGVGEEEGNIPSSGQAEEPTVPVVELSPLHKAAAEGNVDMVLKLIANEPTTEAASQPDAAVLIDSVAGDLFMTPLHFAAASTMAGDEPVDDASAADCVYQLLTRGRADPCVVDVRNRPPYFLASSEKIREAFRRARADLGENYCNWDGEAKVGPPLTEEDMKMRKEKEAEKKRQKRARQKEKKAKDKAQAEELEKRKKEQEEKQKQEEDAKRVRAGLQPKSNPSATNVCDFCQKICKGRMRKQMLQRLDYVYCSAECVQKHKRELAASAALSRLTG